MFRVRLALGLSALLALASLSPAQFGSTKIVETGVNYPGVGTFTNIIVKPSITTSPFGGQPVAFGANFTSGAGVFIAATPGNVTAFATTQTAVPGGSGPFTGFNTSPVALSGTSVAFLGNGTPPPPIVPGNAGNYSNVTGSLAPVVTAATPYPTGGFFTNFSAPAVLGPVVVFSGTNAGGFPTGVFSRTAAGAIATIASTSTPVPGGVGNFINFTDGTGSPTSVFLPNISGTTAPIVVFGGFGPDRMGLFASIGGSLTSVATTATTIPGGIGTFTAFGTSPAIGGGTIAFFGSRPGLQGVYRWAGGTLGRVADTTTVAPGGTTPFSSFSPLGVTTSGGRVAFVGTPVGGGIGLYTDLTGTLTRVVRVGDTIDGKTVANLDIGQFAFAANQIAVLLSFSNGSQGVYTFTPVPEPISVLGVATTAGVGAVVLRRRRRVQA